MRTEEGNKVLLVLGWRTKFYWSWVIGPVLIVRTEEGNKVLETLFGPVNFSVFI
jgi:hypothetical protein